MKASNACNECIYNNEDKYLTYNIDDSEMTDNAVSHSLLIPSSYTTCPVN